MTLSLGGPPATSPSVRTVPLMRVGGAGLRFAFWGQVSRLRIRIRSHRVGGNSHLVCWATYTSGLETTSARVTTAGGGSGSRGYR